MLTGSPGRSRSTGQHPADLDDGLEQPTDRRVAVFFRPLRWVPDQVTGNPKAWGSETPIRARTVPVRSADVVSRLPRRPHTRPSPRRRWPTRPRRRRQGPRDPRPPPSAPGAAADGGPTEAPAHRTGPPRRRKPGHPKGPLGRLPRHPGDLPPVAPRAREEEVD